MGFLHSLIKALECFLFPRTPQMVELEAVSAGKLIAILPESNLEKSGTIAIFDYGNPLVKELIWEVKYKGHRALAAKLGQILYDVTVSELMERNVFEKYAQVILVPMPVSDKRRLERGWNQAELLSEAIKAQDRAGQFKYLPRQLVKIRHTESQTRTADKRERLGNLENSMLVQNSASVAGEFVVVIDDVTTTGATFAEAKRALQNAGARKILCIAVAH